MYRRSNDAELYSYDVVIAYFQLIATSTKDPLDRVQGFFRGGDGVRRLSWHLERRLRCVLFPTGVVVWISNQQRWKCFHGR